MPSINDDEGAMVPSHLPSIVDSHVHVFPDHIFSSVRKWFDKNGWKIRYQLSTSEIFDFLLSRGIKHIVALQYAHKPGIAGELNAYLEEKCREFEGRVSGLATVFPGEDNSVQILQQAFDSGLAGLKLHVHVQCFDMNGEQMNCLYQCCQSNNKPLVIHGGREPKSTAYNCDPYKLCSANKMERVLMNFPSLKVCVPHLGFDEITAYRKLIEKYDNLWLDSAMAISDYFPFKQIVDLGCYRSDRILYGSDFPNIPYAWDRELKKLGSSAMSKDALRDIAYQNAVEFFNIDSCFF